MKRKKIYFIIIPILAIINIVVFSHLILYFAHFDILKASSDTSEKYSTYSVENDEYIIKTSIVTDPEYKIDYLKFKVFDIETNKVVFAPENIWRVSDFKSIHFIDDSNDIIIESGDTGTSMFHYDKNEWVKVDFWE